MIGTVIVTDSERFCMIKVCTDSFLYPSTLMTMISVANSYCFLSLV